MRAFRVTNKRIGGSMMNIYDAIIGRDALKIIVFLLAPYLLVLSASAAGKIGYGSRAGMQVTVLSMSGLDTSNAVIRTQHTREDAIEFCSEYVGEVSEKCIKRELETRLNDSIHANCITGVFTNFWGDKIQFRGKSRTRSETGPRYILVNLGSGEIADGSSASNYIVNMEIFKALCPKKAPIDLYD